MRRLPLLLATLLFGTGTLLVQAQPAPAPTNVVQDCWTTDFDKDPDPELELYTFTGNETIEFTWKQKLLQSCSSYTVSLYVFDCQDGKPRPGNVRYAATNVIFGPISPIPGVPEPLFSFSLPASVLPPGRYDWALLQECDDTNGTIFPPRQDGDINDQCGLNVGFNPATGLFPVLYGPDPFQAFDADPGGTPPGRGPGESGTTRAWCFDVTPATTATSQTGVTEVPYFSGEAARRYKVGKPGEGQRDFDFMEHLLSTPQPTDTQPRETTPDALQSIRNHPNPFRGETTIRYELARPEAVTLTIYDALGRKVRVLVDGAQGAGEHEVTFDAQDLPVGVYFYYMETSSKKYMGKMVLHD